MLNSHCESGIYFWYLKGIDNLLGEAILEFVLLNYFMNMLKVNVITCANDSAIPTFDILAMLRNIVQVNLVNVNVEIFELGYPLLSKQVLGLLVYLSI